MNEVNSPIVGEDPVKPGAAPNAQPEASTVAESEVPVTSRFSGVRPVWQKTTKALSIVWFILVNPAYLLTLWRIRQYKRSGKLRIHTQPKQMILWPIATIGWLCIALQYTGASPIWLGFTWLATSLLVIYIATEDMGWWGAFFIAFAILCVSTIAILATQLYQIDLFVRLETLLLESGMSFPSTFTLWFCNILAIMYVWKFLRRMAECYIEYNGNSVSFQHKLGAGHNKHQRTDHTIVETPPDSGEAFLGYGPLQYKSKSGSVEDFEYPTVAGAALLYPILEELTKEMEVDTRESTP